MDIIIGLTGEIQVLKGGPGSGPQPGNGGKVQVGQAVALQPGEYFGAAHRVAGGGKSQTQPPTHVIERPLSGKTGHFDLRELKSNSISHQDIPARQLVGMTRTAHFENPNR